MASFPTIPPSPSPPSPSSSPPEPEVPIPPSSQPAGTTPSPPPFADSPPPAAPPPVVTPSDPPSPPPSSPPPVPGSPTPTLPPPFVTPISSPPPSSSPPPDPSQPPVVSPPPPSSAPPPDSPPPDTSSAPPSVPAPSVFLPPPTLPTPSPPVISAPPPSPPAPITSPPPAPARRSAPPPPSDVLPLASPPPPPATPPQSSPPPVSPPPSPPTLVPSSPSGSQSPPASPPPPSPAKRSAPAPSETAPPAPAEHSASPAPKPSGSPPPPDSRSPSIPSPLPSAPSINGNESTPSTSPPVKSPVLNPPSSRSPPGNPTPSTPLSPSLTSNTSHPLVPTIIPESSRVPVDSGLSSSPPISTLPSGEVGIKTGAAVGIAVVAGFIVLGLIGVMLWAVKKHKKQAGVEAGSHVMPSPFNSSRMSETSYPRSPTPLIKTSSGSHGFRHSSSERGLNHSKSWLTYQELSEATNRFSSQNLLGEGGFGCVYKGLFPDGREVAVKQLKTDGGQGEREFRSEVEIISRVHHRHLVSLVGYCISENQRLLVYDYVPNNTLHYNLHGEGRPIMDWGTRVRVALGAARGLAYLHEDCHPRIIHRDIKSSNILLDNNFEAKVSDFGLAKLAVDANTHVTTRVVGTFGYLAPEYASSGKLTSKSDVFSFGVVLLELVTGRKPVDPSQALGDESLVEWARPLMTQALETGEYKDLPDPRLEGNYNQNEMFRMIEVAAACVRHSAAMRPHMGQVVRALDALGEVVDLHNGMKPGESELFNSAQHSEEIRLFQKMAFASQYYSIADLSGSRSEL